MGERWIYEKSDCPEFDESGIGIAENRKKTKTEMSLAISGVPNGVEKLKAWALGPQIYHWAKDFQPKLLTAADRTLESLHKSIADCEDRAETLKALMDAQLLPDEDMMAEYGRITHLREKNVAMLEKLANVHGKLTAVSTAALLASMTRPSISGIPDEPAMRDANPRRRANVTTVDIMGDEDLTTGEG